MALERLTQAQIAAVTRDVERARVAARMAWARCKSLEAAAYCEEGERLLANALRHLEPGTVGQTDEPQGGAR